MFNENVKIKYNDKIKEDFIKEYSNGIELTEKLARGIFNITEKFETLADKDVCNFTRPEIDNFYRSIRAQSKERVAVTNSVLKYYKEWCMARNDNFCYDTINYFDTFTMDNFKNYVSRVVLENKFIGYEKLQSYVNELNNPCDQLLLVLLYNGIKGKQLFEIINLHVNQIDGNILHLASGRDVEVGDDVIDLILETNSIYEYQTFTEKADEAKTLKMTGDNVFKNVASVRSDSLESIYHRYSMKLVKFQKAFDNPELGMNRIWRSGMLDAIIKKAKELNMDTKEFVMSEQAQPILKKYEFNQHPSKVIKIFSEYFKYIK